MYRNYKGFYSINMLTVTDANYKFVVVDIGGYGKDSDWGMFSASALSEQLESNSFNLPPTQKLPNSDIEAPYVIIADEGLPLRVYLGYYDRFHETNWWRVVRKTTLTTGWLEQEWSLNVLMEVS